MSIGLLPMEAPPGVRAIAMATHLIDFGRLEVDRLRLRGPNGARDEFHLAATAQNLRKLARLIPVTAT